MGEIPRHILDDIRQCITLSDEVEPHVTWDKKKSQPAKGDWWACCPFHGENSPSFHADNRRGRYKCFGCGASGDVFKFLQEVTGAHFLDVVRELAGKVGVDVSEYIGGAREMTQEQKDTAAVARRDREKQRAIDMERRKQEDEARVGAVRAIWSQARPIDGTLAENYLVERGIPRAQTWPPTLRFHPDLLHPSGSRWPALIGGVQSPKNALVGLWRIYLDPRLNPDTKGRATVDGAKLGLGPCGGGAVRLGPKAETLSVCEGIETGFGVKAILGGAASVWATLSTSGMIGFEVPAGTKKVDIYADCDRHRFKSDGSISEPPGESAAIKLAGRLLDEGYAVNVHTPSIEGQDWLDVWNISKEETH